MYYKDKIIPAHGAKFAPIPIDHSSQPLEVVSRLASTHPFSPRKKYGIVLRPGLLEYIAAHA